MRFIKLGIISFFVIAGIILAISALIPSQVKIVRSIHLPITSEEAMARLADFNQWTEWNEFINDTVLTNLKTSTDEIISDEIKVKKVSLTNDSLITEWTQNETHQFESGFVLFGEDNLAVVQWYYTFKVGWTPWEKFGSAVYERQIGPKMEGSLKRLDSIVGKKKPIIFQ